VAVRGGAGVPVLARREFASSVARIVKARAFGYCSNVGTAGEVRFVSSANGASSAISFLGTTLAWSSPVDLVVDCEDSGDPRGLNGGAWDMVSVEARRTLGTGDLRVLGWVVYEEGP